MKNEKVLVCITIQENSIRLIDKAVQLTQQNNCELHIVHIESGTSIFSNPQAIALLEDLFTYGKEQGGQVHFICDEDIPVRIVDFIEEMGITRVILGESMRSKIQQLLEKDIISYISNVSMAYDVLVLNRKNEQENHIHKLPNEFAY
ncbi:MAG: universal stress protein [Vallitaleaceae bacterium]|jgi:K+-sensing histidine kinase KdpD|nr:universal stress protein [Vallitaleaceae bacterium]